MNQVSKLEILVTALGLIMIVVFVIKKRSASGVRNRWGEEQGGFVGCATIFWLT